MYSNQELCKFSGKLTFDWKNENSNGYNIYNKQQEYGNSFI